MQSCQYYLLVSVAGVECGSSFPRTPDVFMPMANMMTLVALSMNNPAQQASEVSRCDRNTQKYKTNLNTTAANTRGTLSKHVT